VTPEQFAKLSDLLLRRCGLVLPPEKKALARSRLKPVVQRFGFRDTTELLAELPYPSEKLARAITEAMATNETSFFRDPAAFEFLACSALPAIARARGQRRRIRIWCAAASTGQEIYSLAMIVDESGLAAQGWKIDLIATDLSEAAIARAEEGLYAPYEIERGLEPARLDRYFASETGQWRVADRLRHMVTFRVFNLLDHFGWLGEVDLILCRNVLFYFESHAKTLVQAKLADALAPDGYLFLGDNESADAQFAPAASRGVFVKHNPTRTARLAMFG